MAHVVAAVGRRLEPDPASGVNLGALRDGRDEDLLAPGSGGRVVGGVLELGEAVGSVLVASLGGGGGGGGQRGRRRTGERAAEKGG